MNEILTAILILLYRWETQFDNYCQNKYFTPNAITLQEICSESWAKLKIWNY